MNYIQTKNLLKKALPDSVFRLIIYTWRHTYVKIYESERKRKLKNFKSPFFKKIQGDTTEYFYLKIDPKNGYVDQTIYLAGIYEKEIYSLMKKIIKKGDICVDIGANIGMYTNYFPKIIGDTGKVIAFEPILSLYEQNTESILKNSYNNIYLYNSACGKREESTHIYITDENIGGSSLHKNSIHNREEKIKTVRGDTILLQEEHIDFIKIDTEGYELYALEGIQETIKKFRPQIIIEFSPILFKEKTNGKLILDLLKRYYNTVYIIEFDTYLDLSRNENIISYGELNNESQVNLHFYNKK